MNINIKNLIIQLEDYKEKVQDDLSDEDNLLQGIDTVFCVVQNIKPI